MKLIIQLSLAIVLIIAVAVGVISPLSNYQTLLNHQKRYVPTPFEKETIMGTWNGDMPEREVDKGAANPDYSPGGTYYLELSENNHFTLTDEKEQILLDEGTYAIQENSESDKRLGKKLAFSNASGEQLYYGYLVNAIDVDMYMMYLEIEEGKAFYIGTRYYNEPHSSLEHDTEMLVKVN
ncbi:hypothetical protein ACIZ62_13895 [Acetobacterium carbinolicum]|uniref:hypothetical protein n=1 Tax=Acetobacterium carbinolicum TaxID=52690 RepID=UPI0039BF4AC1